jgi:hypothetical protein
LQERAAHVAELFERGVFVDEALRETASRSSAAMGREASSENGRPVRVAAGKVLLSSASQKLSSESAGFAVVHSQCGTPSTRRGWSCRV